MQQRLSNGSASASQRLSLGHTKAELSCPLSFCFLQRRSLERWRALQGTVATSWERVSFLSPPHAAGQELHRRDPVHGRGCDARDEGVKDSRHRHHALEQRAGRWAPL